jgi:hypothetical protein
MNKDSNKIETENRVITPELVFEAFANLPFDYVKKVQAVLDRWFKEGKIEKTFSDRYIVKVRYNEKETFNKIICEALVEVGLENKSQKQLFSKRAKAPSTN